MIKIVIRRQLKDDPTIEIFDKDGKKLDLEIENLQDMKNSLTFTVRELRKYRVRKKEK